MTETTEEQRFDNYKQFLLNTYPRVANREFKALWEEVAFCSGRVEDFHAMTLIRFLEGKGLKQKTPQCLIDADEKWKEESKKYDCNTAEGAFALSEALDKSFELDMSKVFYEYTIDEKFKIEDIMTREMAIKFWEHYNLDMEFWGK
jgi:hypothetical protein